MKNSIPKFTFSQLNGEDNLEIIDHDELRSFIGGGTSSCVFNCFNYLDGAAYGNEQYYYSTQYYLGYTPGSNGEVRTSDIATIGSFGRMSVTELGDGNTAYLTMSQINGGRIMATYNMGNVGHAVIIVGYDSSSGAFRIMDPSNGNSVSTIAPSNITGLYSVGVVGSYGTGGTGSY